MSALPAKRSKRDKQDDGRLDIRTVARTAGVSIATASRSINRVPTVDPKLSERVWKAVKQLGYVPNNQARALVSGRSRLFGVIISDITNPFFPELLRGFEEKAVEFGYETIIGSTSYDSAKMESCIARMLERKVDGVAVMTFGMEGPLLERLRSQDIPMVFVDAAPEGKRIATVAVNYQRGISEAVQHLAVLGHRRIAFISGPADVDSAVARRTAFYTAVDELGLKVPREYVYTGDHTLEQGQTATTHLLRLPTPPTAIMCSNDMTAIGAMHAISNANLSIPRDISLIGFDDVRISQFMVPPLTTVRMSGREIAHAAVIQLKNLASGGGSGAPEIIQTSLVVRRSTSIPAGSLDDLVKPRKSKR